MKLKLITTSKYARRLKRKPSQSSTLVKQALFHGQETENEHSCSLQGPCGTPDQAEAPAAIEPGGTRQFLGMQAGTA